MRTFLNHIKNETLDEIETSLENLWQQMIQLSEFFQYSFVLILKRKCLVRACRVRSGESGTPSTIIYTRWSSRRYELGCDTPVLRVVLLQLLSIRDRAVGVTNLGVVLLWEIPPHEIASRSQKVIAGIVRCMHQPSQWETTLQCPVTMQHCLSLADKMVPVMGTLGHLQTVRSFQYNMMYWRVYTYFKKPMNSPPSTKTRVLPIQSWSLDMDTTTLPSILYFWDDELSSGSLVHETKLIEARNTKHSEDICMIESILSIFITKPSKPTRSSPDVYCFV